MKYQGLLLFNIILLTNCTQNFISYIKTPYTVEKISAEQILLDVGLIYPLSTGNKNPIPATNYPTGNLVNATPTLQQQFYTLQVQKNTNFEISVDTKNYLIATPYYSSAGIIYQADQSTPNQGKFTFISGDQSGQIKIRIYTPRGILQSEAIWYIEVL